jgi:hypothetical protein
MPTAFSINIIFEKDCGKCRLLAPKAFFCYFFAALGKKVEDIKANICTLTVFGARPNPSSTKNWQYQNALDVFSKP